MNTNRNKKYGYKVIAVKQSTYDTLKSLKDYPRETFDETITKILKALKEVV